MPQNALASFLNTTVLVGLYVIIAFAPLAFGAVEMWAVCAVELASAVLFGLWSASQLLSKVRCIRLNPLSLPLLFLAALVVVQLIMGRTAYWYATWFIALLWTCYFIVFFLTCQLFQTVLRVRILGLFLALYGFALAFFAVCQEFTSGGRIYWVFPQAGAFYGPYVNHAHYACFMEMLWPIPFTLGITRAYSFSFRLLLLLSAVTMTTSLFLSHSFGGIVAFFAQLCLLAFFVMEQQRSYRAFRYLLLFLFCFCLWLVWLQPIGLFARLASFATVARNPEWQNRWLIFRDSMRMIREHPFIGWGLGTFSFVYPAFRSFYTNNFVNAAHNDYLQILVEVGVSGFLLTVWFSVFLYRRGIRNIRNWPHDSSAAMSLSALIGCTGFLVHALSDFNLQIPANGMLFFVLAAIATRPLA